MTESRQAGESGNGGWAVVAVAWVVVGLPLLWGVWNTLLKASALFK